MVSVTSASRYIRSASCYQSKSSMYVRDLIPRNFAELAEAVPIEFIGVFITTRDSDHLNDSAVTQLGILFSSGCV